MLAAMVSACLKALLLVKLAAAANVSVLVFGDSYGDTGPTYHQLQDTFDSRGIAATVRSAAIGGTAACEWAAKDNGMSLVDQARKLFPELKDGPEFVWYTLGANDAWQDTAFQACQRQSKTWEAVLTCVTAFNKRVKACTETLLGNYWKAFPKSKVMHTGYDVPCDDFICRQTFDRAFFVDYCGDTNITCANVLGITWEDMYLGDLQKLYPQPQYTSLKFIGAVQKAWGLAGADVGKPVLTRGANCEWESICFHPKYNTPAGKEWGNAFWDKYFSHQLRANTSRSDIVV